MYFVTWFKDTLVSTMCGFELNAISLFGVMCYLLKNSVHLYCRFRLRSSGWKSSVRLEPRTHFLFLLAFALLSIFKILALLYPQSWRVISRLYLTIPLKITKISRKFSVEKKKPPIHERSMIFRVNCAPPTY